MKPTTVQVKRIVESVQDFPGLGGKIKEARSKDPRSVSEICRECGLSRTYWYQLEREAILSPVTESVVRRIEAVLQIDLGVEFEN